MPRRKLGLGGSLALSCSLGLAVVVACNVYDSSLLTGGSEGQGGTSDGGEGSGGTSGTGHGGTGIGGAQGGGSGGSGDTGGTAPAGGTGTGGSKGGTAGMTGGTDPAGGDGGDPATGGDAGGGAGSAGKAGAGNGGGTNAGSGGSGGACGKCGCGKAETPDTDGDGVLDCNDTCTGFNDADCAVLKSGLVHRYSFDGTGTAVMDTKGTAHGTAMGTGVALSAGTLPLAGGGTATADPKQYVDLPDDLLNGLTNATFEAFVTWTPDAATAANNNWHRVFDFGTTATNSTGSYAFLTPKTSTSGASRFAIATAGGASETATGGALVNGPVIAAGAHHFVVSVDDTGDAASLYVDGTLGSTAAFTGTLSVVSDVNNWLGRSNYSADRYFSGVFDEFRIYNVALTAAQLRTSAMAGPNATLF